MKPEEKKKRQGTALERQGTVLCLATSVAFLNPLRYRGYVYDSDTGLYYLQSRYYDPDVCRFINADVITYYRFSKSNLFCYCLNSPVVYNDASGMIPKAYKEIIAIGTAVFVATFALSIYMYAYSVTGARISNDIDISSSWNPMGTLMKNRLKNSKLIKSRIKSYIKNIESGKTSFSKKEEIYFNPRTSNLKDLDLAMSVGHATNCKIKVKNTKKKNLFGKTKYTVTINLSDKYDYDWFDPKEKGLILSAINNGLGYYPRSWGVLVDYNWKIEYSFNYYSY